MTVRERRDRAVEFGLRSMRFRQLVTFNKEDSRGGQKILYFIDPDLIELLALPRLDSWTGVFELFKTDDAEGASTIVSGDLGPTHTAFDDRSPDTLPPTVRPESISAASAVLASEYIFGGVLPGQSANPLLVSAEHMHEIYIIVQRLKAQFAKAKRTPGAWDGRNWIEAVKVWKALQEDGKLAPKALATLITQTVVKAVGEEANFDFVAFARLTKLFRDQRIAPAAATHGPFFSNQNPPDRDLVIRLREAIREDKSKNEKRAGIAAIEADAVTLASLISYNEVREADAPLAVLITRDQSVEGAYDSWFRDQPEGLHTYALRRPNQYHPALNLRDMPGEQDFDEKIFRELDVFIDMVTAPYRGASEGGDHVIPRRPREMRELIEKASKVGKARASRFHLQAAFDRNVVALDRARKSVLPKWLDLASFSVQAKLGVLKSMDDDLDKFIREMVVEDGEVERLLDAAAGDILLAASDISARAIIIRHIAWATSGTPGTPHVSRAPATFLSRPTEAPLTHEVVSVLGETGDGDYVQRLTHVLETSWSDATAQDRYLAIGYMALEFGLWNAAYTFLSRAADCVDHGSSIHRDAIFAKSIAARFVLEPHRALAALDHVVGQLHTAATIEKRYRSSRRKWRILSELSATHLSQAALFLQASPATATQHAGQALDVVNQAIEAIADEERYLVSRISERLTQGIITQLLANTRVIEAWRAMGLIADDNRRPLGPVLDQLEKWASATDENGNGIKEDEAYPVTVYGILESTRYNVQKAAGPALKEIDRAFDLDKGRGAIFELPYIDQVELKALRSVLSAALPPPAVDSQ